MVDGNELHRISVPHECTPQIMDNVYELWSSKTALFVRLHPKAAIWPTKQNSPPLNNVSAAPSHLDPLHSLLSLALVVQLGWCQRLPSGPLHQHCGGRGAIERYGCDGGAGGGGQVRQEGVEGAAGKRGEWAQNAGNASLWGTQGCFIGLPHKRLSGSHAALHLWQQQKPGCDEHLTAN